MPTPLLQIQNLSKKFGDNPALTDIHLTLAAGEIHAVLGENGAGKSTLMNLLYGLLRPDSGSMLMQGHPYAPRHPRDARRSGVGMIHQHFMLVPEFTVAENFLLGNPRGVFLKAARQRLQREIDQIAAQTGLQIELSRRVTDLAVGEQQRVEIVKALLQRCRLLILDEPTAVLTPQEAQELFVLLRALRAQGYGIIFISHKLYEVKALSDRITVLRAGRVSGEFVTASARVVDLARAIAPEAVFQASPASSAVSGPILLQARELQVSGPTVAASLSQLSFEIHAGEILGVAGVDGNGQAEVAEALLGLRPVQAGQLLWEGRDISHMPVAVRLQHGLAHIPADRKAMGLFPGLMVYQNAALFAHRDASFQTWGGLHLARLRDWARALLARFEVRAPGIEAAIETLSGGNQQKLVVGRELVRQPRLLVAVNPTRGVDLATTNRIHEMLRAERSRGAAILLISTELTEIYALADRLVVMFHGRFAGPFAPDIAQDKVSALMLGAGFEHEVR